MGPFFYRIADIQGEYAQLIRTDIEDDTILPVAVALLPMGSDVGTELRWEWGMYEIIG